MATAANDAVARYLANRAPKPKPPPTAKQAEAANQRKYEDVNMYYAKQGHQIASLGPTTTTSVKVDPQGNPVFAPQTTAAPPKPTDWSAYLGMFGLPADVTRELDSIFSRTADIGQATAVAMAYVRGTDWYRQTYPGIGEAIAKGLVRDERDYRSRMNDFAQVYRQYANRELRPDEYAQHLQEGVGADVVARRFQGAALADTYGDDWQYAAGNFGEGRLSDEERTAYGRQAAGLDSPLGLRVQRRLQLAQERIKSVFSGQVATYRAPSLLSQPGDQPPDIGR